MTNLIPVEDHILVQAVEDEAVSKSWFILPESNKEKPSRGKVVAVGKWKILENGTRAPMDIIVGMTVYFTKYAPDELDLAKDGEDKKYLVVKHSSVLAYEE